MKSFKIKTKIHPLLIPSSLFFLAISFYLSIFFNNKQSLLEPNYLHQPKVLGISTKFQALTEPKPEAVSLTIKLTDQELSKISAKAYLVYITGKSDNLISKNASEKLPIASLTKLLTGLVAYENLKFTDFSAIYTNLTETKPIVGIKKNVKYKIEDLFNSMIIGSANDSSQALAKLSEDATKKPIADLMNDVAKKLNLNDSHFSNPAGFDSVYNYSTAEDLKKLVNYTQKIYVFSSLGKRKKYEFSDTLGNIYKIHSTNKLLKHSTISSIKTGYTDNSLGSIILKEDIFGNEVIFIVLGSKNREQDVEILRKAVLRETITVK